MKSLFKGYSDLNQVIWVVPRSSRHVDWNEVAEGEGGKTEISTWHDIVDEEGSFAPSEVPAVEAGSSAPNVFLVSIPDEELSGPKITEFTQKVCLSSSSQRLSC